MMSKKCKILIKFNMIVGMLWAGIGTDIQLNIASYYCFDTGNKKLYMTILKFSLIFAFCSSRLEQYFLPWSFPSTVREFFICRYCCCSIAFFIQQLCSRRAVSIYLPEIFSEKWCDIFQWCGCLYNSNNLFFL